MIRRSAINNTSVTASIGAGENHIGQIGGATVKTVSTFTRPADVTAYAANDIVSNYSAITLTSALRVSGGSGYITGIRIITGATGITPRFRVHFAKTSAQFTTTADNAANANTYANISSASYLGFMDLSALQSQGSALTSFVQDNSQRVPISGTTADIFAIIETLDAFTPISEQTFTVQIFVEQN